MKHLKEAYIVEITKLVEYVDSKEDPLLRIFLSHQHDINSAVLQTARCIKTDYRQNKTNNGQHSREDKRKKMHGQFPRNLEEELVDNEQSYWWLKFGDITGETESTVVAAQE